MTEPEARSSAVGTDQTAERGQQHATPTTVPGLFDGTRNPDGRDELGLAPTRHELKFLARHYVAHIVGLEELMDVYSQYCFSWRNEVAYCEGRVARIDGLLGGSFVEDLFSATRSTPEDLEAARRAYARECDEHCVAQLGAPDRPGPEPGRSPSTCRPIS